MVEGCVLLLFSAVLPNLPPLPRSSAWGACMVRFAGTVTGKKLRGSTVPVDVSIVSPLLVMTSRSRAPSISGVKETVCSPKALPGLAISVNSGECGTLEGVPVEFAVTPGNLLWWSPPNGTCRNPHVNHYYYCCCCACSAPC